MPLLSWHCAYLNVWMTMYEVHDIMTNIASKVQHIVCKLWAELICPHKLAQPVLCWLVQDEASAGIVVMRKEEDDRLHVVSEGRAVQGAKLDPTTHLQDCLSVRLLQVHLNIRCLCANIH